MKDKPTVYLPFFIKSDTTFEKQPDKSVAFTSAQYDKLSKNLEVKVSRLPYVTSPIIENNSIPFIREYTYGAVMQDGVLQGVYLIRKGSKLYVAN